MAPTPDVVGSTHGISGTVAWGIAGRPVTYALEGNVYANGAAVQWLGETLSLADPALGVESLARTVADSGGVHFVPAFAGLGAPHWNDSARALFSGITRGTTAAHLARAALEAIAFQVRDVFDAMSADYGEPLAYLLADGGASRNDLLMQFQADILGRPVRRSNSAELSALGAAYLAGLATGVWSSPTEIEQLGQPRDEFEPRLAETERSARYDGWREALARATYSPESARGRD
jgi:glycerol kinase